MFSRFLKWKHRLGYLWYRFALRYTYWVVERPDKKAGFVSFGERRAVTHFARYYLEVGDKAAIRRRWYSGRVSVARMRRLARRYGLAVAADQLTSAEVKAETLAWPSLVELVIDLPKTVEEYRRSLSLSAISDLNRIRRHSLSMKVSRDKSRLKEFHSRYYLPSITGRHGDDAYVFPLEKIMQLFCESSDSELIEVWCDDVWVGGLWSRTDEKEMRFSLIGWLDGDVEHYRKGVPGALHYFSISRAIERGKQRIIYGGVAPYFEDGLFHAKAKWRARLSCELSIYPDWRVMIDHTHQDCQSFFDRYSLLMKHEQNNQFSVLSGRRQEEVKQATVHVEQIGQWQCLNELPHE